MLASELLDSGAIRVPWPTIVGAVLAPNPAIPLSSTCSRKCGASRPCEKEGGGGEHVCEFGMSYFVSNIGTERVLVFGMRGQKNSTPLNRYTKEGLKGRSLSIGDVLDWTVAVSTLMDSIEKTFSERQSEMLDPLHDPIRLAKQINTIANRLVQLHSPGSSLEQKIDNASTELKSLVKAADLLSDSFDLLSIYFNPNAASFGKRVAISPHGLITKLISIFRIDDGGITKSSTRIFLSGSCYRNIFVHESFKLLPFALLTNAIKYSLQGNIDVVVDDRRQHVEFAVTSVGPLIEESEKELIFQKKGRGQWAERLTEGRGVGLYLAQIIAEAHGTKIRVNSARLGTVVDGIPLAKNTFSFQVPTAR